MEKKCFIVHAMQHGCFAKSLYAMYWEPNDYNKIYSKHALTVTECSLHWGKKDFVGQLKLKQQLPNGAINFAI